jgi:tRNA A37 threonylcarbamoyladenosine dehydratase
MPDLLIDACDDFKAKEVMALWSLTTGTPIIIVGAAGGKRHPQSVAVSDLSSVTHDRILAKLRYQLRRNNHAPRSGVLGLTCISSNEATQRPSLDASRLTSAGSALACNGYGSSVAVTATFAFVAAGCALNLLAR